MNELTPYFGFAIISFMMAVSPGPSWVYTISTTLGQGRRSGMIGNFGNSTGILFHAVAATAGLSIPSRSFLSRGYGLSATQPAR